MRFTVTFEITAVEPLWFAIGTYYYSGGKGEAKIFGP
jgi:hypothetical protein